MSVSQVSETDPCQRMHKNGEKHKGPNARASYNSKPSLQISSFIMTWDMLEMPNHRPDPRTTESEPTFTISPNDAHNMHLRNTRSSRSSALIFQFLPNITGGAACVLCHYSILDLEQPCLLSTLHKLLLCFHLYSLIMYIPSSKCIKILIENVKLTLMYIYDLGI